MRITKHWIWFAGLLLAELAIALVLPHLPLPDDIARTWPISGVAMFAPVIFNFGSLPGVDKSVPVYLVITLLLTPLKVLFWLLWLRSDLGIRLAYFVPSPRYWSGKSVDDFVLDRRAEPAADHNRSATRFSFKGFLYSVILAAFFIGFEYVILNWGWELQEGKAASLPSIQASYMEIANGGFSLWASWGFRNVLGAFFLAVVILIVREYLILFRLASDNRGLQS